MPVFRREACRRRRQWHNSRDANRTPGGVVERLMAPVMKTGRAQALVGSNPTPSANSIFEFRISNFASFLESQRDEMRHPDPDQSGAHHVRQMMGGDVHPRKRDQRRNHEKSEADSPARTGEGGEQCGRGGGMPRTEGI